MEPSFPTMNFGEFVYERCSIEEEIVALHLLILIFGFTVQEEITLFTNVKQRSEDIEIIINI